MMVASRWAEAMEPRGLGPLERAGFGRGDAPGLSNPFRQTEAFTA